MSAVSKLIEVTYTDLTNYNVETGGDILGIPFEYHWGPVDTKIILDRAGFLRLYPTSLAGGQVLRGSDINKYRSYVQILRAFDTGCPSVEVVRVKGDYRYIKYLYKSNNTTNKLEHSLSDKMIATEGELEIFLKYPGFPTIESLQGKSKIFIEVYKGTSSIHVGDLLYDDSITINVYSTDSSVYPSNGLPSDAVLLESFEGSVNSSAVEDGKSIFIEDIASASNFIAVSAGRALANNLKVYSSILDSKISGTILTEPTEDELNIAPVQGTPLASVFSLSRTSSSEVVSLVSDSASADATTSSLVKTGFCEEISTNHSVIKGVIVDNLDTITSAGFKYRLKGTSEWQEIISSVSSEFTSTLTGLVSNSSYEYRAFAVAGDQTYEGGVLAFSTSELIAPKISAKTTAIFSNACDVEVDIKLGNVVVSSKQFKFKPENSESYSTLPSHLNSLRLSYLEPNTSYEFLVEVETSDNNVYTYSKFFKTLVAPEEIIEVPTADPFSNGVNIVAKAKSGINTVIEGFIVKLYDSGHSLLSETPMILTDSTSQLYQLNIDGLDSNKLYTYDICTVIGSSEVTGTNGRDKSFTTLDGTGSGSDQLILDSWSAVEVNDSVATIKFKAHESNTDSNRKIGQFSLKLTELNNPSNSLTVLIPAFKAEYKLEGVLNYNTDYVLGLDYVVSGVSTPVALQPELAKFSVGPATPKIFTSTPTKITTTYSIIPKNVIDPDNLFTTSGIIYSHGDISNARKSFTDESVKLPTNICSDTTDYISYKSSALTSSSVEKFGEEVKFVNGTLNSTLLLDPTLSQVNSNTLSIDIDFNGLNIPLTGLGYRYSLAGGVWTEVNISDVENVVLSDLLPGTYSVQLFCTTQDTSHPEITSNIQTISLVEYPTVSEPVLDSRTGTSLTLSISFVEGSESILEKGVKYKELSASDWVVVPSDELTLEITALNPETVYSLVSYVKTATGEFISSEIQLSTLDNIPPIVNEPVVLETTTNSIKLLVSYIAGSAVIQSKGVKYRKYGELTWNIETVPSIQARSNSQPDEVTISNLLSGETYEVQGFVTTLSEYTSQTTLLTTNSVLPPTITPPTIVSLTNVKAEVDVSVVPGGEPISSILVKYRKKNTTQWLLAQSTSTSGIYLLPNLTQATPYECIASVTTQTGTIYDSIVLEFNTLINRTVPLLGGITESDLIKTLNSFYSDTLVSNATVLTADINYSSDNTPNLKSTLIQLGKERQDLLTVIGYPINKAFDKNKIKAYKDTIKSMFSVFVSGREYVKVFNQPIYLDCTGGVIGSEFAITKEVKLNQPASGFTYGSYSGTLYESLSFDDVHELHEQGVCSVYSSSNGPLIWGIRTCHTKQSSYFGKLNVMRVLTYILRQWFPISLDAIHTDAASNPLSSMNYKIRYNSVLQNLSATGNIDPSSYAECTGEVNSSTNSQGGRIFNVIGSIQFYGLVERVKIAIYATDSSVTAQIS